VKVNKSLTLTVVLLMLTQFVIGQIVVEKEIRGKISVDSSFIEGIKVVNSSNKKATVSDKNGMFSLLAKEEDVLVFSAVNLDTFRKKINKQDLLSELIRVQMTVKSIILEEVIINEYPNISAENLGIIPHRQKKYTPAERKLYSASGGIFGLINTISGYKEMLKKELEVEKKEQLLSKIDVLFEEKYYLKTLKIPVDFIKGFQYYCIENIDFAGALKSKNKTMAMFLIVPLAEKYNQIIENEK
jgi:hypothetical protein